jgi:hypothetical protein
MRHRSTTELAAYLATCPDEVLFDLAQVLGDQLGFNGVRKRLHSRANTKVVTEQDNSSFGLWTRRLSHSQPNPSLHPTCYSRLPPAGKLQR